MTNQENALNWFEIAVADINRSKKFYESIFEIQMDSCEMMGMQLAFFSSGGYEWKSFRWIGAKDSAEKWENILQLYNRLLQIEYSPIAALNRTYALSKANGKQEAIAEAEKLHLDDNHFYHSLLANLYENLNPQKSLNHLEKA